MRGKAKNNLGSVSSSGITPAYAGKRLIIFFSNPKMEDHPRLCGEKAHAEQAAVAVIGSPPPMRGKEQRTGMGLGFDGITPAYAGKSRSICIV